MNVFLSGSKFQIAVLLPRVLRYLQLTLFLKKENGLKIEYRLFAALNDYYVMGRD